MIIKSYKLLGGKHPETATIKNALASLGVKAPHTGKPFTEAMLLGIAGGLGIVYILWEFKKHAPAILVMAFQNKWNYPVQFTGNLLRQLSWREVRHLCTAGDYEMGETHDRYKKSQRLACCFQEKKRPLQHAHFDL